ncbi:MAG TPA: SWIM zinc finger family protein [Chloroflexota bacterium]|nr:SWIM zinc finger family protein [Chloroflexota bacterium]
MAQLSRTWWGRRFMEALERFTDPGRLSRGRSYAGPHRILQHALANGVVTATVRGNINPYFGVYEEPRYTTTIALAQIKAKDWAKVVGAIGSRADLITSLLMNEMPDAIEEGFSAHEIHLLPHDRRDFRTTCSCPDYGDPCKHVAGLCYLVAAELDHDPFLLFELRGLSRERLRQELTGSSLGGILADSLATPETPLTPSASYFAIPVREPLGAIPEHRRFWQGAKRLPPLAAPPGPHIPAMLIKRQGDFPPFWRRGNSFIEVMEEFYERVRTKNAQIKS